MFLTLCLRISAQLFQRRLLPLLMMHLPQGVLALSVGSFLFSKSLSAMFSQNELTGIQTFSVKHFSCWFLALMQPGGYQKQNYIIWGTWPSAALSPLFSSGFTSAWDKSVFFLDFLFFCTSSYEKSDQLYQPMMLITKGRLWVSHK